MLSFTINRDTAFLRRLPIFITFETLVVVVALLITVTSSLILKLFMRKGAEQEQISCLCFSVYLTLEWEYCQWPHQGYLVHFGRIYTIITNKVQDHR